MPRLVTESEAAFLLFGARRTLRYARDAESRGESYTSLISYSKLQCGHYARMRFDSSGGGYQPVVEIKVDTAVADDNSADTAERLARDILGAPAALLKQEGAVYAFTRASRG